MMPPPAKQQTVVSTSWPSKNPYLKELMRLAERASVERSIVVSPGSETGPAQAVGVLVALPLGSVGKPIAVAAIALASGSSAALAPETVAEQLRWGAGWLEALPWAQSSKEISSGVDRAASCLDVLAAIGEQPRLQGMTIAIANDLATRLGCDRVSVGLRRRNGSIRLRAISHSASFKNEGRLVDAIENAMEEAVDQRSSVAYPPVALDGTCGHNGASRSRGALSGHPDAALMSVVLADSQGQVGRRHHLRAPSGKAFDNETLQLAEAMAALLGPIVRLQMRANRPIAGRIVDSAGEGLTALLGARTSGA